jgi:hypothetical protein
MDKDTRNAIQRATQSARALLEREVGQQLEGTYDIRLDGTIAAEPGAHLDEAQRLTREKLVAAVNHHAALGRARAEAVGDYLREAAFTTLNRFVALKMLEARELVQQCVSRGDQSSGFREFCGLAPGLAQLHDRGYRVYLESLFDEIGQEVGILFDRRDPSSLIWPRRSALHELLEIINAQQLANVWDDDETIGWVYQYFNSSEERKQMRDESQAPRNGRELAVRNQFFTPRYIVRFLVDNTLARTWWQMRGGDTRLAEICEFLVLDNAGGLARQKKDPRDFKILDPACGSGHFLLYAFDLLQVIYEESWLDDASPPSADTGSALRGDYPELDDLRRALPGMILGNNLLGVEIDPRAAQIAALALWLRAQRAYREHQIPARERPRITRTHIVVAEPMPGDGALVETFASGLQPPLLAELFKRMVSEMRLAGELGTLLRVDDAIATTLTQAREEYVRQATTRHLPGLEPELRREELDFSEIDDVRFFEEAEAMLLEALHRFSESGTGGGGVRRWLFADDAAQGIALIELVRRRFDVVVMNPPFGASSLPAKKEFGKSYARTKNDLYAAFVERGIQLLAPEGILGAITSRTGFFLSSFQEWREEVLLTEAPPIVFADLGIDVLDGALVEVAAYCLEKDGVNTRAVFLRALEASDKEAALRAAIAYPQVADGKQRFEIDPSSFIAVPRSPFAYWVSKRLQALFRSMPLFEGTERTAKLGPSTADDFRYVRAWWEVSSATRHGVGEWKPFAKGGKLSPFYADIHLLVDWEPRRRTFLGFFGRPGRETERPNSVDYFFRPGLTWPLRTKSALSVRPLPSGTIFGHKGPAAFTAADMTDDLLALMAIMSSKCFRSLVEFQLAAADAKAGGAARSYEVGVIQRTPVPELALVDTASLATLARRAWSLLHGLDTCNETSHAFVLPALLQVSGDTLARRARSWAEHVQTTQADLSAIQAEIDDRCFSLYGIEGSDRRAIVDGFESDRERPRATDEIALSENDEGDSEDDAETGADPIGMIAELVSWAIGVACGRFDLRLATGVRDLPIESNPFGQLPICAPGMLSADSGLLPTCAHWPLDLSGDGILVDDPGDPRDLASAVQAVFGAIFGPSADALLEEAAESLDPRSHNLRAWLASGFFEHHFRHYSKSRRKAPILWQLGTPSGRYSVWLYAHRLTDDSLFQLQSDVLGQKLAYEERQLTHLVPSSGGSPSAKERREIEAQEAFVEELRVLLKEMKRAAPLWKPTLDDGIVLVMAPLWRLVPHKSWQRELQRKWDELAAGKYDWAQLAMHLWPERVLPKCAEDRSLAIAHALEDVFWAEDGKGKWQPREEPTTSIEELVQQRTSPAATDALRGVV